MGEYMRVYLCARTPAGREVLALQPQNPHRLRLVGVFYYIKSNLDILHNILYG